MSHRSTLSLSSWARPLLGLCLLIGLGILTGGLAPSAHAQTTLTVTNCTNDTQLQADVAQANTDNAGDIITFSCRGVIPLTATLSITGNMTLDGNGQSVTLDGGNSRLVLVVNSGATLTLNALTIAHGSNAFGGGLLNDGTVTISNSTFANNSALNGGGLFNASLSTMTISNSTFSNNGGGALFNDGTLSISNSTFAYNSAPHGGGLFNANDGTLNISKSTFAYNSGGNCSGSVTDQGYNLESGTDCGFTASTDLHNTNPQLASGLASNGGPTQTIALLQTSPAIDRIPAASCPATDQRGMTRPDAGESTCDIGAYESNYVDNDLGLTGVPANITTNATSPQGAVVTYTPPTATDESGDNPTATVTCTPASGSTFAIGTTTVTCTATDSDDSNSPVSASFTVTVNGAATQISALIALVNSFHFSSLIQGSLDAELRAAQVALQNGQPTTACNALNGFVRTVNAFALLGSPSRSQASQLIAAATQIKDVIGC